MPTPIWQAGTFYVPGSIVRRVSTPPAVAVTPTNPDFASGDTGWTKGTGWSIVNTGEAFTGSWSGEFNATATNRRLINIGSFPVLPGQSITANCQVNQGPSSGGVAGARVELDWLDVSNAVIATVQGNLVDSASNNQWKQSTVTAVAPANAVKARVAASAFRNSGSGKVWVDTFTWNYAYTAAIDSLVFRAVQANAGYSGPTEPVWPASTGLQVIDNQVTWEAIDSSRIVWEASPILVSGTVEPTFPTSVGSTVADGSIIWTAVNRRITDVNCPNSKAVTIAASKVFAGDDDIIRYCATVNPLDWTTPDDAGYLPFGLQTYGSNPVAALGLYRANLVAFNSQGFQMWQVDQDPANMAFLDAVPTGSTYVHTWVPVSNDLVGLTSVGVRNLSIAGASTNLQADGVGEPVDSLVKAKIKLLDADDEVFSLFWPAAGQHWTIFALADGTSEAFVLTINAAKKKSWSRYVFPEEITDWTLDGNTLVLRTALGHVWEVSDDQVADDVHTPATFLRLLETGSERLLEVATGVGSRLLEDPSVIDAGYTPFTSVVHWPYLDMGAIGVEKGLVGIDLVCDAPEGVAISVGYNQQDITQRTPNYEVDADSLTGQMVPFPVSGPSFDLKLTFEPLQQWEFFAANMYVNDWR
jgi:hypothetical protein